MAAYRGKLVEVELDSTAISGDGRSITFEESGDALDSTKYGDDARVKIPGLTDASGSMEAIDSTGAWTSAWSAIKPGTAGALQIFPEGNTSTNRVVSCNIVVTSRSLTVPYDDIATFSMGFDVSGDVTESVVA